MVSRMTVGILRLLKREPQPRTRRARPGAVSKEQIILMMGLSAVKEGAIVPTAATALKTGQSIVACPPDVARSTDESCGGSQRGESYQGKKVRTVCSGGGDQKTACAEPCQEERKSHDPSALYSDGPLFPRTGSIVCCHAHSAIISFLLSPYTHTFFSGAFWDKRGVRYDHGAWLSSYYFASVGMTPARYS